ncbi:MAG: type IV pilus biogenesis/stability protein PilW [Woeseiaceae bacterium]|nr:type IV pilus biogenesis/stability protein PilW [Woeseiaceae bacterium]
MSVQHLSLRAVLIGLALTLAGCISTTTGTPEPVADDSDAAGANFQLGIRYFQNGKFELARDRLILSTELDGTEPLVWSTLGMTYERLENPRLAEESHARAARLGPRNFDVQNAYAVFLCNQRRFDDARRQFDKSIRASTNDNPEVMMTNAGVCMSQEPDYDAAEEYFRQALERRPSHAEALLQMAVLKHRTDDDLRARAFLQRYRAQHPTSAGVLYLCVLIERNLGDESARTDCANELLRDFPDSVEAQQLMAANK